MMREAVPPSPPGPAPGGTPGPESVRAPAFGLSPDVRRHGALLRSLRRKLHRIPEAGFQEHQTSAFIRAELRRFGVPYEPSCGTGTVALVRGGRPGPTILIRADMDGLPILEENRFSHASVHRGMMHACGHDGHVAMGLVAAKILASRRERLAGNVKFMFQPAEEGPGGAGPMIEAGVLRRPRVEAAFAIHLWNRLPTGTVGVRPGPVFASQDQFRITVVGRGGHGASPHQTVDPVVAAAHVVTACQTLVSRRVDPTRCAVVTFGQIHGGSRHNIIPDSVELSGTVRTYDDRVRRQIERELPRIAGHAAAMLGARIRHEYRRGYPATVNDVRATAIARRAVESAFGREAAVEHDPAMGSEDMALVLREVPGCYLVLGSTAAGSPCRPHHSARYDFDERALAYGVEIWTRLPELFRTG